jgi:hypothetical protein
MTARIDHVASALARLPQQLRGKTRLEALVTSLAEAGQSVEDALMDLFLLRYIDTATGTQLDVIGSIVGQARLELSDADYRRFIRARISTNRSTGTGRRIIRIARLILNDSTLGVVLTNYGTAAYRVRITDGAVTDAIADILLSFLTEATVGGVRVLVQVMTEGPAGSFRFDAGPPGLGFGYPARLSVSTANMAGYLESTQGAAGEGYTFQMVDDGTGVGNLVESGSGAVFHFEPSVTTTPDFEAAIAASTYLRAPFASFFGTLDTPGDLFSDVLTGYTAGGLLARVRSS